MKATLFALFLVSLALSCAAHRMPPGFGRGGGGGGFRWGQGGWGQFGGHPGTRIGALAARMLGNNVADASGTVTGDVNATGVVLLAVYNYSGDYNIRYGAAVKLTDAGLPTSITINDNATSAVVLDFGASATWTNLTWSGNCSALTANGTLKRGARRQPPFPKFFGFFRPPVPSGFVYGFAGMWYNASTITTAAGPTYKDVMDLLLANPSSYYAVASTDAYPNGAALGSESAAPAPFSPPPVTVQPPVSSPSLSLSLFSLLPLLPLIVADRVLAEPVPLFENGADVLTAAGSGEPVTNGIISLLFGIAVVGLVVLTGGVAYLAYTDWQDKREMEKLAAAEPVKRPTATSEIRAAMKSPPRATPKGHPFFPDQSEAVLSPSDDSPRYSRGATSARSGARGDDRLGILALTSRLLDDIPHFSPQLSGLFLIGLLLSLSWLAGRVRFGLLPVLLVCLFVYHELSNDKVSPLRLSPLRPSHYPQVSKRQRVRELMAARVAALQAVLQRHPMGDSETAHWLNALVQRAWPVFLERLLSTQLAPALAPWFFEKYLPWQARKAWLERVYLGSSLPVIAAVRVVHTNTLDDHVGDVMGCACGAVILWYGIAWYGMMWHGDRSSHGVCSVQRHVRAGGGEDEAASGTGHGGKGARIGRAHRGQDEDWDAVHLGVPVRESRASELRGGAIHRPHRQALSPPWL
ncbi:unnamed protein product [Closterium sp. Yama58-4]|nr:unnamed protein product [Closterium sp. Yama58-4]